MKLKMLGCFVCLLLAGCGTTKVITVDQVHTETNVQTVTIPHTTTKVVKTSTSVASPEGIRSFSGNGGKNLGAITIASESTLDWTNDGGYFGIYTNESIPVNSQAHSGSTVIEANKYSRFQVNAVGNWTIKIVPK